MARAKRRRKPRVRLRTKVGAIPGTIKIDPKAPKPVIRAISYDVDATDEIEVSEVADLKQIINRRAITWINVDGLGDKQTIEQIRELFDIHPLALEDAVNVQQRAKVEEYDNLLFIVVRMISQAEPFRTEQVSIFLGSNFVLTLQEKVGDCFDPIRARIRQKKSRLRNFGPDYLTYRIIDAVIDSYFPVLDQYADMLEELEDEFESSQGDPGFHAIQDIKGELVLARRTIRPHRDAVNTLLRDTFPQISEEIRVYLRDCADHTLHLIELVETYREICGDLRDYYLSIVSNRMNETMKVLTMIATIFIPLGFIAGLYGMNFDSQRSPWNMPELHWVYGYPMALGMMAAIAISMVFVFRRKRWL